MDFLRVLDAVRSITGKRGEDHFVDQPDPLLILRSHQDGRKVVMVHESRLGKAVLESPAYRQYNFVEKILSIAKPERTGWINRFCDLGLIMIDGDEHQQRRLSMNDQLERCVHRLIGLPPAKTAAILEKALRRTPHASARDVSRALVLFLVSECVTAITGKETQLPEEATFAIDFFNPFPTLSSLYRGDDAIERCCEAIDFEGIGEAEQAAILSLMVMGVSPLYAMFTAMMNTAIAAVRTGQDSQQALRHVRGVDAYSIVATNFVMRECVAETTLNGEKIDPGDILYLFLGSARGCPFSRQTAIPFGAGQHYCSGAKLTSTMLGILRSALQGSIALVGNLEPSDVEQGKATAFLTYMQQLPA